jgi:biopolymer transport protein ExbD
MRIKDPISEAEEPFNLVPLTDMVFNLLIFFMAATTFTQIEKDMSLQLPKTSAFRTLSAPPQQLVINIRQDGSTWVNGNRYESEGLKTLISSSIAQNADREVLIRADERSYMQYFAGVAAQCRAAGVKQFKIGFLEGGKG